MWTIEYSLVILLTGWASRVGTREGKDELTLSRSRSGEGHYEREKLKRFRAFQPSHRLL